MKKLLMVLIILVSTVVYAETKITVSGKIEIGYAIENKNMLTNMELGFTFYSGCFSNKVYGGYTTWYSTNITELEFYPFRDIYGVGNKMMFGNDKCIFFVDVYHFCNHAVKSNGIHKTDGKYNSRWYSNLWGETITTVKVGCEFEFPVWVKKRG